MTSHASLEWTVHLAGRRPRRAVAVLAVILTGSAAAGFGFQSVFLGCLAAVLLVASVGDFLFPVHYSLDESGIQARGLLHRRRMSWRQVQRVMRDDRGVKLSPLPRPSRLEAYRGIYVWFAGNESDVMATIAHHVRVEAVGGDDLSPG